MLDNLVTALVGQSNSQKSKYSDESLKQNRNIISRMISILAKTFRFSKMFIGYMLLTFMLLLIAELIVF